MDNKKNKRSRKTSEMQEEKQEVLKSGRKRNETEVEKQGNNLQSIRSSLRHPLLFLFSSSSLFSTSRVKKKYEVSKKKHKPKNSITFS